MGDTIRSIAERAAAEFMEKKEVLEKLDRLIDEVVKLISEQREEKLRAVMQFLALERIAGDVVLSPLLTIANMEYVKLEVMLAHMMQSAMATEKAKEILGVEE